MDLTILLPISVTALAVFVTLDIISIGRRSAPCLSDKRRKVSKPALKAGQC